MGASERICAWMSCRREASLREAYADWEWVVIEYFRMSHLPLEAPACSRVLP